VTVTKCSFWLLMQAVLNDIGLDAESRRLDKSINF
jgi:hypothetical protein